MSTDGKNCLKNQLPFYPTQPLLIKIEENEEIISIKKYKPKPPKTFQEAFREIWVDANHFPNLIKDLPAIVTEVIIIAMNPDTAQNWRSFVCEVWPKMTMTELNKFEEKKMKKVLEELISKGETTVNLFHVLNKLKRKDVFLELEKHYPNFSQFLSEIAES